VPRRAAVASRPAAAPPPHPADVALAQGKAGRDGLPAEWRAGFDAVRSAFDHAAVGRDDAARDQLQSIGLGSPFLEWKLLLRGMLAYYAGDDGRALDNWSRLAPGRLPARVAAPLRFVIDPAFRSTQPPKAHADLLGRSDRLRGGLLPGLRSLQASLSGPYHLANAFRQADTMLPALRRDWPDAVPRLAEAFRTAIIAAGHPEDLATYGRLFGTPPDDPKFERLEALTLEDRRQWHDAHQSWQKYERTLAHLPTWSAADIARARALVWCRMGQNAVEHAADPRLFDRPRPFKPSAEMCFRRALEVAPDLRDAHEDLFDYYRRCRKTDKMRAAGEALLTRFPDHVPTLEALADLARDAGDPASAREYLRRALTANPLDTRLRDRLSDTHRAVARGLAVAGDVVAARAELAAGLALREGRADVASLALDAAIAFKAGDATATEELLSRALAAGPRVVAAYILLAESARLRLPVKVKRRFAADFAAILDAPPDARTALELVTAFRDEAAQGDEYVGRASHGSKVQKYVKAAIGSTRSEAELERLSSVLAALGWPRLLKTTTDRGRRIAKDNPFFLYYEALGYQRSFGSAPWKIGPLLDRAERLAEKRPRDERTRQLLADIADLRERSGADPMLQVFEHFFGGFADTADDRPF
jgi:tetratricopeptide (TPR) repeat protein